MFNITKQNIKAFLFLKKVSGVKKLKIKTNNLSTNSIIIIRKIQNNFKLTLKN